MERSRTVLPVLPCHDQHGEECQGKDPCHGRQDVRSRFSGCRGLCRRLLCGYCGSRPLHRGGGKVQPCHSQEWCCGRLHGDVLLAHGNVPFLRHGRAALVVRGFQLHGIESFRIVGVGRVLDHAGPPVPEVPFIGGRGVGGSVVKLDSQRRAAC